MCEYRKSSHSHAECFEARQLPDGTVECRNSHDPDGPLLRFSRREWGAFVRGVVEGDFNFD